MKKYKLTTQALQTHGGFQWTVGKKETTSGEGELCSKGWLHYYHHPLLAVLLNPLHANIDNPKLFEVEAEGKHLDDKGLKGGCTEMTLLKEIELPQVTTVQRTAFGILCAKQVCKDEAWNQWADKWLSGEDRSEAAADAAWSAADGAWGDAWSAAWYAADGARSAAWSAADGAWGAASAARSAADGAWYAASAADAARSAAWCAADAAADAADGAKEIDLGKLAEKALKY